ncbi:MAG: nucleotidyltransferase family protein [Rhodospirillales bacterium]|nr:nucleotidyltransferase family protein [Rhodospirillales bacterium]
MSSDAKAPIRRAMVLAAGLGTRMRPITHKIPKPLVNIAGRTLLDRAIDRLEAAGIRKVVVNVHHLADKVVKHLKKRTSPKIQISDEPARLETGGGVARALPMLGKKPFFVINGDILWLDGPYPSISDMAAMWDDERMDALLLLQPTIEAYGYEGDGDFLMDANGRIVRRRERHLAPYLFSGIQILHPRLFNNAPSGSFSLNVLYDRAIECERLYGYLHDGEWFHVGRPSDLEVVDAYLSKQQPGIRRK